jgi:hypothetical protein
MEAPPGFEPGIEVLQTSALPLGDGAGWNDALVQEIRPCLLRLSDNRVPTGGWDSSWRCESGAGNGIRTRDFDLGKVALYH